MKFLRNAAPYTIGFAIKRYNTTKGSAISIDNAIRTVLTLGYKEVSITYGKGFISHAYLHPDDTERSIVEVRWDPCKEDFYAVVGCCASFTSDELYAMALGAGKDEIV